VQGVFLRLMLERWGEKRVALLGLASNAVAFALYGLARHGWMMYAIILANMIGFAAGPALQGIVSKSVDPAQQGIAMGSLNGLSSIMSVLAERPRGSAGLRPGQWKRRRGSEALRYQPASISGPPSARRRMLVGQRRAAGLR
jgi:DHA1 family tetracycline resistance protein-like MFS transporter